MVAQIKRFFLLIWVWFKHNPAEPALPFVAEKPVPAPPKPAEPKEDIWTKDSYGEFYFRENILDQLDYYMLCLKRMRKVDHAAYQLYRQTGANVFPYDTLIPVKMREERQPELEPWFRQTLPAFGAVFWGERGDEKKADDGSIFPRFMYFQKYDRRKAPPNIQRVANGSIYEVTSYWDNPDDVNKIGFILVFPILVREDGTLALLRVRNCNRITIKHKQGQYKGQTSSFTRQEWQLGDPATRDWASLHKDLGDIEQYLTHVFVIVANNFERANTSMIRVSAERGNVTAAFGVNIKRTPYFFKDREVLVNQNGNRKRIFHIVRPHIRRSGSAVHMHFRGMREFNWNGYNILITVPGLHHAAFTEFDAGSLHHEAGEVVPEGVISTSAFARKIRNYIHTGSMDLQ